MTTTSDLRLVRVFLDEQRTATLTGLLTVSSALRERTNESKRRLTMRLRELDEFANPVEYEEYSPQ
ncbi:hypothetical protein [Streptomyces prunicolor]|uniref:Uncharacterized protein n=1 Tax=Streptomyces prunicolor TaxID=67348 RepID=A0ABU4FF02_9ACTN|nr:hypothetical protein [Streptomyces prunicolor]MDV7219157.1 hypothetical protein [Streptomyces prunicolor]